MKGIGLSVLPFLLLPCIQAYYILIASHSGNYNTSTSLPAWERLDAPGTPSFIVAEDIAIPLQLTRCDELILDVTLEIAEGSIPTDPVNVTFWIFSDSVMQGNMNKPFDPSLALTNETFTQPFDGSWTRAGAVENWTQGPQAFYVVTPRFRLTKGVALRGNMTYWVAMLIGQERKISPLDSTFNTPRWLQVGTPSTRMGSPALFKGVDRFGNMFRAFPTLANWSNASFVESVAMPFLANTATMSETHQMSFTVFVGSCYAPPNVIIPSSRNFTDLPSPTAYTIKPSPVAVVPVQPTPRPPTPLSRPVPGPMSKGQPSPPPSPIPIPLVTTTVPQPTPPTPSPFYMTLQPSPGPVVVTENPWVQLSPVVVIIEEPIPWTSPSESHAPINGTGIMAWNPFGYPVFIGLLIGMAFLVIIGVLVVLIIWARRWRTRLLSKNAYDRANNDDDDKTIEMDDGNVRLSEDNSSSDSVEIQTAARVYNSSTDLETLKKEHHDGSLTTVPLHENHQ